MEQWDIYDACKRPTGRIMDREDWHMQPGEYHLTVLARIRDKQGRILITRRVLTKSWAAGWWEIPGGGVRAGETSREAINREVQEETGLDVSGCEGELLYTYSRENPEEGDNYFVDVWGFDLDFTEEDIRLQTEESMEYRIAEPGEVSDLADRGVFLHYQSIRSILEQQ